MTARFETYQRKDGQFGFRLIGGNGEKMAGSEGYTTREHAIQGVADVVNAVADIYGLKLPDGVLPIERGDDEEGGGVLFQVKRASDEERTYVILGADEHIFPLIPHEAIALAEGLLAAAGGVA